jgi:hypothetical protein
LFSFYAAEERKFGGSRKEKVSCVFSLSKNFSRRGVEKRKTSCVFLLLSPLSLARSLARSLPPALALSLSSSAARPLFRKRRKHLLKLPYRLNDEAVGALDLHAVVELFCGEVDEVAGLCVERERSSGAFLKVSFLSFDPSFSLLSPNLNLSQSLSLFFSPSIKKKKNSSPSRARCIRRRRS